LHQLALASCLLVLTIFWLAEVQGALAAQFATATFVLGAGLMIGGAALRGRAIQQLRERFVTSSVKEGEAPLLQTGAYAWMRHPSETGLLLIVTGAAVLLESSAAAAFTAFALIPLTLLRIRLEERGLSDVYGAEFRTYRKRVPALIPFVV
jgi:protein-S-isoprenylcysteine O-methyltransferase Ste14